MCFSAEADFVSGALISGVGVATLTKVEEPRQLALGVLPLALGLHQLVEGFVWLGLDGKLSPARPTSAIHLYVALRVGGACPCSCPSRCCSSRRPGDDGGRWRVCVGLGVAVARLPRAGGASQGDVTAYVDAPHVQYGGAPPIRDGSPPRSTSSRPAAPPLLSRQPAIVWFGTCNLAAVAVIALVQVNGLTSVWCVWAALVSVLIYVQFAAWRRSEARVAV